MRVLILGYGSMGRRHARNAKALGHEVHAYDPQSAETGADVDRWYMSEKAARRCHPDAVVIATPAESHADLLAQWDKPGLRVFVEKPLALSCADYWRPRQAATPAATVAVGYSLRFHPLLQALRAYVRVQPSPPAIAHFHLDCDGRDWPGHAYAETLLECSHELDLAHWLLGTVTPVDAERLRQDGWRADWRVDAMSGNTRVSFRLSTVGRNYQRWCALTWPDGHTAGWGWHVSTGTSLLYLPGEQERTETVSAEECYARELEAFLEGDWEAEQGCRLGAALATLAACDKAATLAARLAPVA